MSVESHLRETLAFTGLPCAQTMYTGTEDTYLVFNYTTIPASYADDKPQYERYLMQIHVIAPITQNVRQQVQAIKKALVEAGYSYPSVTDASDDSQNENSGKRNVVLEFETVEAIMWDI